jgi:Fur family ferric uptake transcriptional regulator
MARNMTVQNLTHQLLLEAKLRNTPVRMGVIRVLERAIKPLTAVEIHRKMRPETGMVTLYRTLKTLLRKSIVHRVRGEDRAERYAMSKAQSGAATHHHPHFMCDGCGQLQCLKQIVVPVDLLQSMKMDQGYTVTYSEVILHGTCSRCRRGSLSL